MLFRTTDYSVTHLVEAIDRGDVALPDIQRPFVWKATKVRSLFDSMYKGFPVGFLLFWETDAEPGARRIGSGDAVPRNLIVDGQQRLTSLYAVMKGIEVVRENYDRTRIRIAFRPADGRFEVTDAAIEKDPEFIPDISVLWAGRGFHGVVREFIERLSSRREVPQEEQDRLTEALDRCRDLSNYSFKVMELSRSIDEEQVAEIFVRINSEGVTLNQADFILTLMSVFWEKGRVDLEEFCRGARQPTLDGETAFNWYLRPQPDQLLRVSVALAFRRAVLKQVYQLLRGKGGPGLNRDQQFALLAEAQSHVLDLGNWHDFLQCLERAGFRGAKMVSSDNAILFTYAIWLFGRSRFAVPPRRLEAAIARWFFMAHMTGRYSGNFETQAERDFAMLGELRDGDADAFCAALDRVVDSTLTNDFWNIGLPNELATSASRSPSLSAYLAALNIHDAPVLLSRTSVRTVLDPAKTSRSGIRRDHLFPRAHLQSTRQITQTQMSNRIANMTLVDWKRTSGEDDPARFWPTEVEASGLTEDEFLRQRYLHALPDGWEEMGYQDFLSARQAGMARVIRDAFALLGDPDYSPDYPSPDGQARIPVRRTFHGVQLSDLVERDLLEVGATLVDRRLNGENATALVTSEGFIEIEGEIYESPSAAAAAVLGTTTNGWEFWHTPVEDVLRPLSVLRSEYMRQSGQVQSAEE
ncbi:GmrSD restriction endonuclease domain-containing protein [Actinomadura geliboluensis]|uniref:GmrSD restriction endonuclease domain-containing protein n=1 Tax=Actinomadura geliboluensis TaxID=882440 RepID=UPI0036BDDDF7